eukprot:4955363-Amphidinium_carterae.1
MERFLRKGCDYRWTTLLHFREAELGRELANRMDDPRRSGQRHLSLDIALTAVSAQKQVVCSTSHVSLRGAILRVTIRCLPSSVQLLPPITFRWSSQRCSRQHSSTTVLGVWGCQSRGRQRDVELILDQAMMTIPYFSRFQWSSPYDMNLNSELYPSPGPVWNAEDVPMAEWLETHYGTFREECISLYDNACTPLPCPTLSRDLSRMWRYERAIKSLCLKELDAVLSVPGLFARLHHLERNAEGQDAQVQP